MTMYSVRALQDASKDARPHLRPGPPHPGEGNALYGGWSGMVGGGAVGCGEGGGVEEWDRVQYRFFRMTYILLGSLLVRVY